ncbi:MAG: hypothetical protein GXX96_09900 [Planctomycetaceae bacterium]|nr:hypothetical protein [Planctomycetaceae bacterium]
MAAMEARREIDQQRQGLDEERREIAQERYWDSLFGAALTCLGVTAASLAPIVLAIYLLKALQHQEPGDAELADLLVREIVSDRPMLLVPERPLLSPERLPLQTSVAARLGNDRAEDDDAEPIELRLKS